MTQNLEKKYNAKQVADYFEVSRSTISTWKVLGRGGKKLLPFNGAKGLYTESQIKEWEKHLRGEEGETVN